MTNSKTPMTPAAADRIVSANAPKNNGQTPKGSFAATAQSFAAKNVNNVKGGK